ncbi:hypothetical protein QOT17_017634 [Balamuthia mandrillaris]
MLRLLLSSPRFRDLFGLHVTDGGESRSKQVLDMDMMKKKLKAVLEDKDFFPRGVTLAFHYQHTYSTEQFANASNLSVLLKGFDALLYDAATSLGLGVSLQCFFSLPLSHWEESEKVFVVCDTFPGYIHISKESIESDYHLINFVRSHFRARLLVDVIPSGDPLEQSKREATFRGKRTDEWCTNKPDTTEDLLMAVTAAYGNEPSTRCFYASALLFVELPPKSPFE